MHPSALAVCQVRRVWTSGSLNLRRERAQEKKSGVPPISYSLLVPTSDARPLEGRNVIIINVRVLDCYLPLADLVTLLKHILE